MLKANLMIAGYDKFANRPKLYWLDSIGSILDVDYGAHGAYFSNILSFLDRHNSTYPLTNYSRKDGIKLLSNCWEVLQRRAVIDISPSLISTRCVGSCEPLQ
jgi:20S proteasome alpha/beta subunit